MSKRSYYPGLNPVNPVHRIFNYIVLIMISIIIIYPMLVVFMVAFKTQNEMWEKMAYELPDSFLYLENFKIFIKRSNFLVALKNTIILAVVPTFAMVIMGTMIAYIVTRFQFVLKKTIMALFIGATFIPPVTTVIAQFVIIKNLGLYNTLSAGLVLYSAAGIIEIYIFIQHMENIPISLDESALIDGASYFQIYRKVILPLMTPAIATATILRVIYVYNDIIVPRFFMPSARNHTLVTGFMKFTADRSAQWEIVGAGVIMLLVPATIIYIFIQRFLIAGLTQGSVKS